MNGPIKMYRTKQIIRHDIPIQLPECMYRMKNIHARNGMVDSYEDHVSPQKKKLDIIDQNNQYIPGMAELEAKQEDILKQLAELKKQILSIKLNLKGHGMTTEQPVEKLHAQDSLTKVTLNLPDIVIYVNPNTPPYSLAILQRVFQGVISLRISTHLHSTVSSLPESTKQLEECLIGFKPEQTASEIHLRLIWKYISNNVETLITFLPIVGEVNLLRYLCGAFPSLLSYYDDSDSIQIDSVLDLCHQIVKAKTKTERSNLLQSLNKFLGKSQWFFGRNKASIADIAAYSAIQQISSSSELNVNMRKWFERCLNIF